MRKSVITFQNMAFLFKIVQAARANDAVHPLMSGTMGEPSELWGVTLKYQQLIQRCLTAIVGLSVTWFE